MSVKTSSGIPNLEYISTKTSAIVSVPDEVLKSVFGPTAKLVCICLPYCGVHSLKLKRQLSRILSAVCPWRTHALMNVPYGNPHGPIVVSCKLHFSIPYTRVFLCVLICTVHCCTCYFIYYLMLSCCFIFSTISFFTCFS